jgi:hypothetical protein
MGHAHFRRRYPRLFHQAVTWFRIMKSAAAPTTVTLPFREISFHIAGFEM